MSIPPETFCNVWNVREFYHLVRFHAWEAHGQNEYQRLIGLKHQAK